MNTWHDNTPIYRQLKERMMGEIIQGLLNDGDVAPSVRQVAAELQINPITVSRAYQELTDEGILEKRRGLGTYVAQGARKALLAQEQKKFLDKEWPLILERMRLLDLTVAQLPHTLQENKGELS